MSGDLDEGWVEEGEDGDPALELWVVIVWEGDGSEDEGLNGKLLREGKPESVEGEVREGRRSWGVSGRDGDRDGSAEVEVSGELGPGESRIRWERGRGGGTK